MTQMKYKGYIGSAEVSVEDGVVFGKLLHINDLVTFEADNPSDLRRAFEDAVDDYLADCQASGREADRPFKGSFNVRVKPELHRELAEAAVEKAMTLNEYVARALSEHNNCIGLHGRQDLALWSVSAVRAEAGRGKIVVYSGKNWSTPAASQPRPQMKGDAESWAYSKAAH